jgi:hypothetical protein
MVHTILRRRHHETQRAKMVSLNLNSDTFAANVTDLMSCKSRKGFCDCVGSVMDNGTSKSRLPVTDGSGEGGKVGVGC